MTVIRATAGDRARWNGYVERSSVASVYHRWEWGEIFEAVYGVRAYPLMAVTDNRVTGVLPLVRLSSPLFGTFLVGMPYFAHGGALADDDATWRALVEAAGPLAREAGARHVELRHDHPVPAAGMPTRDDKVLMHLALPADEEAMLKQVGAKARADIRRPEKEGLTARVGGAELIPAFHSVYAAVMRDLGSPCHNRGLFEETWRRLPDRSFVATVAYQGRTIGGGFLVGQGSTLEIPCAGTLHSFSRLRANMLLYWTVIREAIRRGYKTFSFGRSSKDSGTYAFKKGWGAAPVPLPYHYVLSPGATLPTTNPDNPKYARAIAAWQKLPVPVATVLGPQIVRHLA